MKKLLVAAVSSLSLVAFAGSAMAGGSSKVVVTEKAPVIEPAAPCFDAGPEVSAFVAGIFPDEGDDEFGGGVSFAYFFTPEIGVDLGYHVFATSSEEHFLTADLVYRCLFLNDCIAPYGLVGAGAVTNGSTDGLVRAGLGIDFRTPNTPGIGYFVDATYNWVEGDRGDAVIARLGVRFAF